MRRLVSGHGVNSNEGGKTVEISTKFWLNLLGKCSKLFVAEKFSNSIVYPGSPRLYYKLGGFVDD